MQIILDRIGPQIRPQLISQPSDAPGDGKVSRDRPVALKEVVESKADNNQHRQRQPDPPYNQGNRSDQQGDNG